MYGMGESGECERRVIKSGMMHSLISEQSFNIYQPPQPKANCYIFFYFSKTICYIYKQRLITAWHQDILAKN